MRHRVKVVNRFEITGNFFFARFIDFFLFAIDELLHFHCFLDRPIEPIDAGHIGTKIESQRWIDAQETRHRRRMFIVDQ
jgi:hypothetical protein